VPDRRAGEADVVPRRDRAIGDQPAREAGVDRVLARSAFVAELGAILTNA
jgi:hypothetical protein